MRILWVKPGKLLPLNTGGKLRTYHILRHLSAAHEVTFLSYYRGDRDQTYEKAVLKELPGAITIHGGIAQSNGLLRYLAYAGGLLQSVPFTVTRFTMRRVQRLLASRTFMSNFDAAVCDFLASSLNFPRALLIPSVLFQHNVETLLWQRRARFEANWRDRLAARLECSKMERFEPEQIRRFRHVFAVSEQDREAMQRMEKTAETTVIPTGVDLTMYRFDSRAQQANGPVVVFAGSMDWKPNIDAVEYFSRKMWPQISASVPGARFRIVGRDPDARVWKLASPSIEVTGTVPSMAEYLREAAVLVVPIRIGGGTRIKIYEGMAMGKPTVSTNLGAEGLDVLHGRDILLSDDPREFAEYVVNLLRNEELRRQYGAAAALTAGKHDWSVVAHLFAEALQRVVTRHEKFSSTTARSGALFADLDSNTLQGQS